MATQQDPGRQPTSLTELFPGDTGDRTEQSILDAALQRFIERGLHRTTMEDVANAAGVGRATVYRRFGDKDSLIQAVILRECRRNLQAIEIRIAPMNNKLDALLEAFVVGAEMAHQHPLLTRLLQTEPEQILPQLVRTMGAVMQFSRLYLAQQIRLGEDQGDIAPLGAEKTAEMILRLFQSLVLSPEGLIHPGDGNSTRSFAESHLRPLLQPQA